MSVHVCAVTNYCWPGLPHLHGDITVQLYSNKAFVFEAMCRPVTTGNSVTKHHSSL